MTILKKNFEKITETTNNLRSLDEIENKDAVIKQQIINLNKTIDEQNQIIKNFENLSIKQQRPHNSMYGTSINLTIENHFDDEYSKAFNRYLRQGIEPEDHNQCQNINSRDSGYKITNSMNNEIINGLRSMSVMRKISDVVSISRESYDLVTLPENIKAGWSIEEIDQSQNIPINKIQVQVHELYAQPKATQQMLDDSSIDIEGWFSRELIDVFSNAEENAFINGDGKGKPNGLINNLDKIKTCYTDNNIISVDDVAKLYYSLNSKYSYNAKFIIGHDMAYILRTLKNNQGSYLWQPSMQLGQPDTILGKEVLVSQHMPQVKSNNNSNNCISGITAVFFGDFSHGYKIIDRQDIRVLRDPFTQKPYVKFYTTKRVGGTINNPDAIRALCIKK
ncbi:phage major capsid protein [Lyticum sinuosum]|uniref:Phage major capsid protein, HK97 family n=1 Tax=Lyticum sinuosum TaxID=1332059 RepID=A0AAE4VJ02_9RICK|nr:phage major capsid protein [Lyticum sinuosum]MDZ5760900.1 Phage major capsid protein, HK97 family [Lyticum sinuosum]